MKTRKKRKVKKMAKAVQILKAKELLNIRGGGDPTGNDNDFD